MEGDYEDKRILAGSLFTKKLFFGNEGCRTTEVNEVIEVLTRNSNHLKAIKNEKAVISDSFSANVPEMGSKPNFKTEDFHNMLEVIEVIKPYLDI